uniref:Uncharacterized protein n=1 Tax=Alexandrium monilatum TaxID=311494 RepID=A0A7S4QS07_9DINO
MARSPMQYEPRADPDVGCELLPQSDNTDEESGIDHARPSTGARSRAVFGVVRTAGLVTAGVAVCCMLAALSLRHRSTAGPLHVVIENEVGLQQIATDLGAIKAANPDWDPEYWDDLVSGKKAENTEVANQEKTCSSDEEIFAGLCYKKCELLAGSEYPIRTTAFTCCKETPCHPFNSRKDMGFCSGFSIAGGDKQGCPHPPSSCQADEEVVAGVCYKKCSLLTGNEYSHRLTNMACCKMSLSYKCLFHGNLKLSSSFNVGSGVSHSSTSGGATSLPPAITQQMQQPVR